MLPSTWKTRRQRSPNWKNDCRCRWKSKVVMTVMMVMVCAMPWLQIWDAHCVSTDGIAIATLTAVFAGAPLVSNEDGEACVTEDSPPSNALLRLTPGMMP